MGQSEALEMTDKTTVSKSGTSMDIGSIPSGETARLQYHFEGERLIVNDIILGYYISQCSRSLFFFPIF